MFQSLEISIDVLRFYTLKSVRRKTLVFFKVFFNLCTTKRLGTKFWEYVGRLQKARTRSDLIGGL